MSINQTSHLLPFILPYVTRSQSLLPSPQLQALPPRHSSGLEEIHITVEIWIPWHQNAKNRQICKLSVSGLWREATRAVPSRSLPLPLPSDTVALSHRSWSKRHAFTSVYPSVMCVHSWTSHDVRALRCTVQLTKQCHRTNFRFRSDCCPLWRDTRCNHADKLTGLLGGKQTAEINFHYINLYRSLRKKYCNIHEGIYNS